MRKLLLFIPILASCVTQEKCLQKFPPQTEREVTIERTVEYRDTTITIEKESLIYRDTIICDEQGIAHLVRANVENSLRGQRSQLDVILKDNILNVSAQFDSLSIEIEKYKELYKEKKTETIIEVHTVKEEYIPWWVYSVLTLSVFITLYSKISKFLPFKI